MARELRAIIPCGPGCWYAPFIRLVNERAVSLKRFVVYHMDECLDWQGRELPRKRHGDKSLREVEYGNA
ncbi:MAG: hypothetical protein ABSF77_21220 [Spirochaetia bacterium]|jgi:glucosamine-6-phosphate deaminase